MMRTEDPAAVPNYAQWLRLDDKGFVVLGAGQGIGRQVCHALSQAGAQVLCVDVDEAAAIAIADEVGGHACAADVLQRRGMERVFDTARKTLQRPFGIVDIVGRAMIGPIGSLDDDAYQAQHDIVFKHAWLAVQIGAPLLAEGGGGTIVFVGSLSGEAALHHQALYGSAKAALHHFARCAAIEYAPRGVRINVVAPGPTRTSRLMELVGEDWSAIERSIPLQQAAAPADIAGAVLFLASDLARQVTAQLIAVDGGALATISRPSTASIKPRGQA